MSESKNRAIERKKAEEKLNMQNADKAAAAERFWLKGNRTSMEQNIIDAGRQKINKPKKE